MNYFFCTEVCDFDAGSQCDWWRNSNSSERPPGFVDNIVNWVQANRSQDTPGYWLDDRSQNNCSGKRTI